MQYCYKRKILILLFCFVVSFLVQSSPYSILVIRDTLNLVVLYMPTFKLNKTNYFPTRLFHGNYIKMIPFPQLPFLSDFDTSTGGIPIYPLETWILHWQMSRKVCIRLLFYLAMHSFLICHAWRQSLLSVVARILISLLYTKFLMILWEGDLSNWNYTRDHWVLWRETLWLHTIILCSFI